MHYYPGWTEEKIMNMSWDNFSMYMEAIPRPKIEKPKPDGEDDTEINGEIDLFNMDTLNKD